MPFADLDFLAAGSGGAFTTFSKPGIADIGGAFTFGPNLNWDVRLPPDMKETDIRKAFEFQNRLLKALRDRIVRLEAEFSRTNRRALGEP